jgi:hypothetical protein
MTVLEKALILYNTFQVYNVNKLTVPVILLTTLKFSFRLYSFCCGCNVQTCGLNLIIFIETMNTLKIPTQMQNARHLTNERIIQSEHKLMKIISMTILLRNKFHPILPKV